MQDNETRKFRLKGTRFYGVMQKNYDFDYMHLMVDRSGRFWSCPGDKLNSPKFGDYIVEGSFDMVEGTVSWREVYSTRGKIIRFNGDTNQCKSRVNGRWDWNITNAANRRIAKLYMGIKDDNVKEVHGKFVGDIYAKYLWEFVKPENQEDIALGGSKENEVASPLTAMGTILLNASPRKGAVINPDDPNPEKKPKFDPKFGGGNENDEYVDYDGDVDRFSMGEGDFHDQLPHHGHKKTPRVTTEGPDGKRPSIENDPAGNARDSTSGGKKFPGKINDPNHDPKKPQPGFTEGRPGFVSHDNDPIDSEVDSFNLKTGDANDKLP